MLARLGVIALVFGLTPVMGLQAQENEPELEIQPKAAQEESSGQSTVEPAPVKPPVPLPANEASAEHDDGSAPDTQDEPQQIPGIILGDGWAQWAMALTGLGALLVSVWAVRLLKATLKETREAVRAADDAVTVTQKIGTEQLRAYLAVKTAHIVFDDDINVARITLRNFGQTPAYNVRACFFRSDERLDEGEKFREEEFTYLGTVPPNGEICKDMPSDEFRAPNIVSDVILMLSGDRAGGEDEIFFWVVGKIVYQDAFGRECTEFSEYKAIRHNGTPTLAICRNESS